MPAEPSIEDMFNALAKVVSKNRQYGEIATAHIAAKHGIYTIPSFHNSAVPESEKHTTYKEVIIGLAKLGRGENHGLLGGTAEGQAPTGDETDDDPTDEEIAEGLTTRRDYIIPEKKPKPAAPPPPAPARTQPAQIVAPEDPLTARLRELIRELLGPIQAEAQVDEACVRKLIEEHVAGLDQTDAVAKAMEPLVKTMREELEAKLKNVAPREVQVNVNGVVNRVTGVTHCQFLQICTWAAADVPLWLWGPAGGGKTTIGQQVAEALGVPFYCISIDETITVGKLVGFKNLTTGEYVEGLVYRPYKEGGVLTMDEMDTNSTTMAALNAMFANDHYTFGNGERVKKHPNFRVIAGANTKGTGAVAGYTARVRLDAATLDRFAVIELKYDWDMITQLTGGQSSGKAPEWKAGDPATQAGVNTWVAYVKRVSEQYGQSVLISPRVALLGAKALSAGIPVNEVADALLFKLMTSDTRTRICNDIPIPTIETAPVAVRQAA